VQRTTGIELVARSKNRKGLRHVIVGLARAITGRMRITPDFILVGAQKCGTTSLYHNLTKHPNVMPCFVKEVHYFDVNFSKGIIWYQSHFPSRVYKYIQQRGKQPAVTGESSPYYLFHPHAPRRVSEVMPRVKLIAILRNPLQRAYSHYHHEVRMGFETLSFEDAVEQEQERLLGEREKMIADEDYYSFNHRHYSYLSRGIYVDQLMNWMRWFSRDQILILKSEDFYQDSRSVMKRIAAFLELPGWEPMEYSKYNAFQYPTMDATMRARLIDFFKPHNQRLSDFLGTDIGWDA
jgi:hypothetical protein